MCKRGIVTAIEICGIIPIVLLTLISQFLSNHLVEQQKQTLYKSETTP